MIVPNLCRWMCFLTDGPRGIHSSCLAVASPKNSFKVFYKKHFFSSLKMHSGEGREKHGKHLLEQQLSIMAVMLHSIFIDIVINAAVSSLDEKFSFHSWMDTTFLMSPGGLRR